MIKVGIAGIGFMGMTHYRAYGKARGAKVAALCETDEKRLAGDWRSIQGNFGPRGEMMDLSGISRYRDLKDFVADPSLDLIDICLPPSAHANVAVMALEAGKHVFCEKPIALRAEDADKMVRAAKKARKMLMIGQVLPFFPEYDFAYKAITSGKYGKVLGGHFKRIISDPLWMHGYYDAGSHGGPMIDLHVHDAHFIRLVFGLPKAVQSVGSMRGKVAERFTTQFLFSDPRLTVTASSGVIGQQGRPFTHGYEIYLEKATLIYDAATLGKEWVVGYPVTLLSQDGKVFRPEFPSGDPTGAFVAEVGEVLRAVRTGVPSKVLAGNLARDALALCQAQTRSVKERRAVKV
jgi:predicted dehydrogenase